MERYEGLGVGDGVGRTNRDWLSSRRRPAEGNPADRTLIFKPLRIRFRTSSWWPVDGVREFHSEPA